MDSDIFIRTRSKEDSRRTLYALSEEMIEPICNYYMSILGDFATLYGEVLVDGLSKNENLRLIFRLGAKTGWDHSLKSAKS